MVSQNASNVKKRFSKSNLCPVCETGSKGCSETTDDAIFCGGGGVKGECRNGYTCCSICPNNQHFSIYRREGDHSSNGHRRRPQCVEKYDYLDEAGNLRHQTLRYDGKEYSGDGDKTFKQRRPDGKGDWIWKGVFKDITPVLYHLPQLLKAPITEPVCVMEGEKDVHSAERIGLVATTNAMGAGTKWLPCYNEFFRGKRVILLPDNDDVGRKHMEDVRRNLEGIALSVTTIALPGLPHKGDLTDWLNSGGTKHGLLEMAAVAQDKPHETNGLASGNTSRTHENAGNPGVLLPEPWEKIPLDCFPRPLKKFISEAAGSIGCDPSLVALPVLSAVAGAIGMTRRLRLKSGWFEHPILWTMPVAKSGEHKTPSVAEASNPLHELEKGWRLTFESEIESYERHLAEWKEDKTKTKPVRPALRRLIAGNATIQSIGIILKDNPRGVVLIRDELSAWFELMTKHNNGGSTDDADWLELHSYGWLTLDRVSRHGSDGCFKVRAACSICGGIQPAILGRVMTDARVASGLMARFLPAMPPARMDRWSDDEIDDATVKAYGGLIGKLCDLKSKPDGTPETMRLDDDAKDVWVKFFNETAARRHHADDAEKAMLSKTTATAARLALVFAVASQVADYGSTKEQIGVAHIEAGVKLANWFAREWLRVYHAMRLTPEQLDLANLVDLIRKRGGTITARDLQMARHRKYPKSENAERALKGLVAAGLGTWVPIPTTDVGGCPTQEFVLSAPPCGNTTPQNTGNNGVLLVLPPASAEENGREPGEEG